MSPFYKLSVALLCACLIGTTYQACTPDQVFSTIKTNVQSALTANGALAAGILRMFFHDCAVNGCDASVLLDNVLRNTERYATGNNNMQAPVYTFMDNIKRQLDTLCGGPIVSCADILAVSARDVVVIRGGPTWQVPLGRKDGTASSSITADLLLPSQTLTVAGATPTSPSLRKSFSRISTSFTDTDIVAILGAHTLGISHCSSVADRIVATPTVPINATFKAVLTQACAINPQRAGRPLSGALIPLDIGPTLPSAQQLAGPPAFPGGVGRFDRSFYVGLQRRFGVLTSDQTLFEAPATQALVIKYATNQNAFFADFAAAMQKLQAVAPGKDYPTAQYGIRNGACNTIVGMKF